MNSKECFKHSELLQFHQGLLEDEQRLHEICRHLEDCEHCVEKLDEIRFAEHSSDINAFGQEPLAQADAFFFERLKHASEPPAPMPSEIGKYRIDGLIAKGGAAHVYKAFQPELDRFVVIKVLKPHRAIDKRYKDMFDREKKLLGQINHQTLVQAYDTGSFEGNPYIVMHFFEGRTLREKVKHKRQLSVQDACRIMFAVGELLGVLHSQGIVHRDIKPSNIMCSAKETKVIDLGLARAVGEDVSNVMAGTPGFMAPEREGLVATSLDIYSFGATLFYLIVGRVPRGDSTDLTALEKLGVPDDVRTANLHALERDPNKRLDSISTLLPILRRYGEVEKDESAGWWEKAQVISFLAVLFALVVWVFAQKKVADPGTAWDSVAGPASFVGLATSQASSKYPYQVTTAMPRSPRCCAWRPNHHTFAVQDATGEIRILSLDDGNTKLHAILPGYGRYEPDGISWSRDGSLLASAGDLGQPILIWKGQRRLETIQTDRFRALVRCLVWSPHKEVLAIGDSSGIVRLFDSKGTLLNMSHTLGPAIKCIDWHPRRDEIAVGTASGEVVLLDAATPFREQGRVEFGSPIASLNWHPAEEKLAILGERTEETSKLFVTVHHPGRKQEDYRLEGLVGANWGAVRWSEDGSELVGAGFNLRLWENTRDAKGVELKANDGQFVCSVQWRSGNLLVIDSEIVRLWNRETNAWSDLTAKGCRVLDVASSPSKDTVAVGTSSGVSVFGERGEPLWSDRRPNAPAGIAELCWSKDGDQVFGVPDGVGTQLYRWKSKNGSLLEEFDVYGSANSLDCSPDGKYLAVSGNHVSLFELPGLQRRGKTQDVGYSTSVRFSPSGSLLAYNDTRGVWVAHVGENGSIESKEHFAQDLLVAFLEWSPSGNELLLVCQAECSLYSFVLTGQLGLLKRQQSVQPAKPRWTKQGLLCGMWGVVDEGGRTPVEKLFRRNFDFDWMPSGRHVVGGNWYGELRYFDATSFEPVSLVVLSGPNISTTLSDTGEVLAGNASVVRYVVEAEPGSFETLTQETFLRDSIGPN